MAVIKIALVHPVKRRSHPNFHLPMRRLDDVKCNSGNIASGNCSANTT